MRRAMFPGDHPYQVREYLGSAAFSKAVQCVDLHSGELVTLPLPLP